MTPILPSEEQFTQLAAIAGTDADGPKVMLNLNRYRERAAYDGDVPDGLVPDVSGREAYLRYGVVAARVLSRLGGRVLWEAESHQTVVGESGEHRRGVGRLVSEPGCVHLARHRP